MTDTAVAPAGPEPAVRRPGPKGRLVLASFLMLFVELALIRWTAANVVYLAFFTNFILLASFLGIGIGFLRARAERDLFPLAPVILAGLVLFVLLFPVQAVTVGRRFSGLGPMPALPQWVVLPILFLGATAIMAAIAQGVARIFVTFEPLQAYRLDIMGSILGIAGFSVLAFLRAPPLAWAVVAAVLFWVLAGPSLGRLGWAALAVLILGLAVQSFLPNERWSPYYKVTVSAERPDGTIPLRVNNIPHQSIHTLDVIRQDHPWYLLPYEHARGNPLRDVLIVGAGTGNDVAVALSQGAGRVDAVEIDPVLHGIGRDRHPEQPYQDPRVDVAITDGRAFLERSDRRYDLILFALPDSLTLVSGQAALRLESYLFTEEAMQEARRHLKPGGVFTVYNYYRPLVGRRLQSTLGAVYGREPCVQTGAELDRTRRQVIVSVSDDPDAITCPPQAALIPGPEPARATDDYPFPYFTRRTVPPFYGLTLLAILAASVALIRGSSGPLSRMRPYLDLFFMGAAFLLLETKSIVQFALLFGTTWFVNALVFTGILLAVLGAVEVARRVRLPRPWVLYAALLAAVGIAFAVPTGALLTLPMVLRFAAAVALAFTPIFLANLVFAQRFKDVSASGVAFGANLLGAMLGGVLEYGALLTGYRALLIAVAGLYLLAYLFGRRHLRAATG